MKFKLLFLDKTAAENQFISYFFSISDFIFNPNFFPENGDECKSMRINQYFV